MTDLARFLPEQLRPIVTLRPPQPIDEDRILDYFESLGETSRAFFHPHPFDAENARKICQDACSGAYRVIAECGSRIVGYAWFSPFDKHPYPMVGVGVSDDFQGRRLGGALMDVLISEARKRKHKGLGLTVYKNNERGIRLYTSRGFRITGEEGAQHVMELTL